MHIDGCAGGSPPAECTAGRNIPPNHVARSAAPPPPARVTTRSDDHCQPVEGIQRCTCTPCQTRTRSGRCRSVRGNRGIKIKIQDSTQCLQKMFTGCSCREQARGGEVGDGPRRHLHQPQQLVCRAARARRGSAVGRPGRRAAWHALPFYPCVCDSGRARGSLPPRRQRGARAAGPVCGSAGGACVRCWRRVTLRSCRAGR